MTKLYTHNNPNGLYVPGKPNGGELVNMDTLYDTTIKIYGPLASLLKNVAERLEVAEKKLGIVVVDADQIDPLIAHAESGDIE